MQKRVLSTNVPVALAFPDGMAVDVMKVLNGEYECGYFGQRLAIVDIGANVGSFTLWANLRWPQSVIHAYEPHPETFGLLTSNVGGLDNVACHNAAVFPSEEKQALFSSRYAGDGESGLITYLENIFEELPSERTFTVPVLHPSELPACDVLKIDTEGAEPHILRCMNLSNVSVILLEYHHGESLQSIKGLLESDFSVLFEEHFEWDALLNGSTYRRDLKGDIYGHLFLVNKRRKRLWKIAT